MTVQNFDMFRLHENEQMLLMLETLNDLMSEMYMKAVQDDWHEFEILANGCIQLIEQTKQIESKELKLAHHQRKKKVDLILDFLTIENRLTEHLSKTHYTKKSALILFEALKSSKRK